MFAAEFEREVERITTTAAQQDRATADRLGVVTHEIENLAANMLAGVLSPTLTKLLSEREAEKMCLEAKLAQQAVSAPSATILPHPALLRLFKEKVGQLCETLNDQTVRGEAAEILSTLIESVTIYPEGPHGPEAEVVAKVSDLLAFATNANAARGGGVWCSMAVVAGTGFEPVTFRL